MNEGEVVAELWADGDPLHAPLDRCLRVDQRLDWLVTEGSPVMRCVKGSLVIDRTTLPFPVQLPAGKAALLLPGLVRLAAEHDEPAYVWFEGKP